MGYFDICEICGESELLILDGLCFRCKEKAERAGVGGGSLRRPAQSVSAHRGTDAPRITLVTTSWDDRLATH